MTERKFEPADSLNRSNFSFLEWSDHCSTSHQLYDLLMLKQKSGRQLTEEEIHLLKVSSVIVKRWTPEGKRKPE